MTIESSSQSRLRFSVTRWLPLLSLVLVNCGGDRPDTAPSGSARLTQALSIEAKTAPSRPDYQPVPHAGFVHKSCIHEVPPGTILSRTSNGTHVKTAAGDEYDSTHCSPGGTTGGPATEGSASVPPPALSGWIENSSVDGPLANGGRNWFNGIHGQYVVPSKPTFTPQNHSSILFLFNDLQEAPGAPRPEILQPVLQYGIHVDACGAGTDYWSFASYWAWYDSGCINPNGSMGCWEDWISTPICVNVNDTLTAAVDNGGCNNGGVCNWNVTSTDGSASTNLHVSKAGSNPEGDIYGRAEQGVLEMYPQDVNFPLNDCRVLPSNGWALFENTYLYQPPLSPASASTEVDVYNSVGWGTTVAPGPSCNYSVQNTTRGTTLNF